MSSVGYTVLRDIVPQDVALSPAAEQPLEIGARLPPESKEARKRPPAERPRWRPLSGVVKVDAARAARALGRGGAHGADDIAPALRFAPPLLSA